jgi:NADP-dependent 3-hydroxy acid dehydrogenase YdfG
MNTKTKVAVIAGIGSGFGEAMCKRLIEEGYQVAGLSRSTEWGMTLAEELGNDHYLHLACDLTYADQVNAAISEVEKQLGRVNAYIHNVARLHFQPFVETDPYVFESLWRTVVLSAVHGSQRVLPGMLENNKGMLLFIGATASVNVSVNFSAFGSAKFALRGLAQSLAREFGPQGVHVSHVLIDGVIWGKRARETFKMSQDQCVDPKALAETCMHLIKQDRSAWTNELDLRPDVEKF